jgi:hypothetical protein
LSILSSVPYVHGMPSNSDDYNRRYLRAERDFLKWARAHHHDQWRLMLDNALGRGDGSEPMTIRNDPPGYDTATPLPAAYTVEERRALLNLARDARRKEALRTQAPVRMQRRDEDAAAREAALAELDRQSEALRRTKAEIAARRAADEAVDIPPPQPLRWP